MALTSTSFTTTFDLTASPNKLFGFIDTTNYAAQGIALSTVKCVLTITAPGGAIIYTNSNYSAPDIDPVASLSNIIPIQIPLDAGGNVVQGAYIFSMTSRVITGMNPAYYVTQSYNYTYEYASPTVVINQTANCITPLFTSTDETVYTVNNIIPTISRDHSVFFPIGSGLSNITNSTAQTITLGSGLFANGTQTTEITTILSYDFGNGLYVVDSVTGVLEIQVSCEWTCKITCCLKALNNRMESQRCSNYQAFLQTKDIFTQVMSKVTLVLQFISCGKQDDANAVMEQIKELANCTDDCCGQDTPSLVTGISGGSGSSANVVVNSGGAPITVNSVTVGSTTTYTVTLDPAFATIVNNSYNTVLAPGGGITWTDSGVIAGVRTFTPSLTIPSQNMMAFKAYITFQPGATPVSITVQNVEISGTTFQAPTVSTLQVSPSQLDNNCFVVDDFFDITPNGNYKVYADLQIKESNPVGGLNFVDKQPAYMYEYTGGPQSSGSFQFRFDNKTANATSSPLTYKLMAVDGLIVTINFLIIA